MSSGKFIAIDGVDGSGKGTQAKLLANYIFDKNKANHVFLTREPYNSEHYDEIREILKESSNPRDNAELLAELFVKDREVHAEVILDHLLKNHYIVSDRYKYSTLAYQQTQGIPVEKLIGMHCKILVPDLALIIDVPANVALERIARDSGREYKEMFEKLEFQEQLRTNFLELPSYLQGERIVIIDGNRPVDSIFESIKEEVDKIL